ncbi:MAG: glycosyltransferase [Ginsengibacter sp.]
MKKKTIIHFIYSLQRGGAEVMLVRVLKELPEYRNIVVELYGDNVFGKELQCDEYISLDVKSNLSLPLAIFKLRKIIKISNADLVHSHLFWPTIIARLATPRQIPLLTTIHTAVSMAVDYKIRHVRLIDRLTYRFRKNTIIAVSKSTLNEYAGFIKQKMSKSYLLYTFVDADLFKKTSASPEKRADKFRMVSVGALREGKNFEYLIKSMSNCKATNIELHIYGEGVQHKLLQTMIDKFDVPVYLKGEITNLQDVLPQYDLYVSSSQFEGFSLSILEAMAVQLPLLLSDIPSFREQCGDTAIYFDLKDENDFIVNLRFCIDNPGWTNTLSCRALERVLDNYTLPIHTQSLKQIYSESLDPAISY